MDYLCLYITLKLSHCPIRPIRTSLAAFIGAVWALAVTLLEAYTTSLIWRVFILAATVLSAAVMIGVATGERKISVRSTFFYIAVSTSLGGMMTALYGFITKSIDVSGERVAADASGTSPILFILAALISGVVSLLYGKMRERNAEKTEASLTLTVYGKTKTVSAFADSGNLLCDPISGKPVIIVSSGVLSDILPEEILAAAREPTQIAQLPESFSHGLHLIPAKSVTGNGLLLSFKADEILIGDKRTDAVVAIDVSDSDFGGYGGIIPPILLDI